MATDVTACLGTSGRAADPAYRSARSSKAGRYRHMSVGQRVVAAMVERAAELPPEELRVVISLLPGALRELRESA